MTPRPAKRDVENWNIMRIKQRKKKYANKKKQTWCFWTSTADGVLMRTDADKKKKNLLASVPHLPPQPLNPHPSLRQKKWTSDQLMVALSYPTLTQQLHLCSAWSSVTSPPLPWLGWVGVGGWGRQADLPSYWKSVHRAWAAGYL